MVSLSHPTLLVMGTHNESLPIISVRNNGHKTKLKGERRKFIALKAI
jgi:hypothetical protein